MGTRISNINLKKTEKNHFAQVRHKYGTGTAQARHRCGTGAAQV